MSLPIFVHHVHQCLWQDAPLRPGELSVLIAKSGSRFYYWKCIMLNDTHDQDPCFRDTLSTCIQWYPHA